MSEVESALLQYVPSVQESQSSCEDPEAPMTAAHRKMLETTDFERPFTKYVSSHQGITPDKIKEWTLALRICTKFTREGLASKETASAANIFALEDAVR